MKKLMSVGITVVAFLLLAGCASGPSYQEHASMIQTLAADSGRIYLYRKTAFGALMQPDVRIDDEVVGEAVPGGFFYVDLPPGTHVVSASTEAERKLSLTLDANEEKYVRLEIRMGLFVGHVKPVLVDSEVGREEIQKMKFTGQ